MTEVQLRGAKNFMSARCSICHNGPALTDNQFHNVAVAQFGPGQGRRAAAATTSAAMRRPGPPTDRYAFRTPPLRNVELTAPYGHDGAFFDLREFVAHYSESDLKLRNFDASGLEPAAAGHAAPQLRRHPRDAGHAAQRRGLPATWSIDEVTEFMKALTDPAARDLRAIAPASVPSGLPVDRP